MIPLTKRLAASDDEHLKWVSIYPVMDQRRFGHLLKNRENKIVYLVIIFEMNKVFTNDMNNDITLDMGKNIQKEYFATIDEIFNFLKKQKINSSNFSRIKEDKDYPI